MRTRTTVVFATVALALALALVGCGSSGESASSSRTASTTSTTSTSTPTKQRQAIATTIQGKLDLAVGFPDCQWTSDDSDAGTGIVNVYKCASSQLLLAVAEDHANVEAWMDDMKTRVHAGYGLLGDNYALVTPDQGARNRARDLLGGDGEPISFAG